jgi:protein disulfide-isomerase
VGGAELRENRKNDCRCAAADDEAWCQMKENLMKRIIVALFVCCVAGSIIAADSSWMTSVPDAKAKAEKENKLVLLDFTGSDWCIWCKRLNAEIFSKSEFTDYAKKNLVLVEVDFPHVKVLSEDQKAANSALAEKYKIAGYPTLVMMKPDGTVVWQGGYMKGGPPAMIAQLDAAKQK